MEEAKKLLLIFYTIILTTGLIMFFIFNIQLYLVLLSCFIIYEVEKSSYKPKEVTN